jgi:hypothetical protein
MGAETNLRERCDASTRDIEATRRRIQEKVGVLEDRLKPRSLLQPLKRRVDQTLGEGGGRILDAFRDHPLPLALTGLGLGWMLLRDLRGCHGHAGLTGEGEREGLASRVKEKAAEAVEKTRGAVEKARAVPGKVQEGAHQASEWLTRSLDGNPGLWAVGALAAGVLAGLLVPTSRKEDQVAAQAVDKAAEAVLEEVRPEEVHPAPEPLPPPGA